MFQYDIIELAAIFEASQRFLLGFLSNRLRERHAVSCLPWIAQVIGNMLKAAALERPLAPARLIHHVEPAGETSLERAMVTQHEPVVDKAQIEHQPVPRNPAVKAFHLRAQS